MTKVFKNLKFRLLLGIFIFLLIIFYSFGHFLIGSLKNSYTKTIEVTLSSILKDIKYEYKINTNLEATLRNVKDEFDIHPLYSQVTFLDTKAQTIEVMVTSDDLKNEQLPLDRAKLDEILKSKEAMLFTTLTIPSLTKSKIRIGHIVLDVTEQYYVILSCGTVYDKYTPYVKTMTVWLLIGLSVLLVVILLMVYFIISHSLLNVQQVIDEARSIKVEDVNKKITKTHIAKEIDNLIDTFNTLLHELQYSYLQVKQFGQNASHELKTPLTIIRGEIEVGLKKERTPSEYQYILETIHHEITSLQDIIEKILFLSSTTKGHVDASFEMVYIDEIVQEAIEEKKSFAMTKDIALHVNACEPLTTRGNATLLKIAIANLIDNAIKYSPSHSMVNIALLDTTLSIENSGLGINEEELPRIFERFYRGKMVQDIAGVGLGLAIVKTIFDLHGFRMEVKSAKGEATKVSIFF